VGVVGVVSGDVGGDFGSGEPVEEGEEVGLAGVGGEFGEVFVEGEVAEEEAAIFGGEVGEGLWRYGIHTVPYLYRTFGWVSRGIWRFLLRE